ncbi:MAG: epimerase [Candidatus Entotheonella gemina]|uniref:Epimerase n=1 Tax=Candidatus Entotheonella gemina TaxID=1429439 RepID=W4MFB5_9BACT|nr:MAG: epimerase [Candidatus Entotheonella gemina]
MNVLVMGATGGSGMAAVEELLNQGHRVTAFSRHADQLDLASPHLTTINGDVMNMADVDRAIQGHDAVIVTLGISENALRVRLFGSAYTPGNVRSMGTRNLIASMHNRGVRRLVVQTSFGVGETRTELRVVERLLFKMILAPQIQDTEIQEQHVRQSGLDWVLAQPVHLTDDKTRQEEPFVSLEGRTRSMKISRSQVARFLTRATQGNQYVGRCVALSG